MKIKWEIWMCLLYLTLLQIGLALKCYECDNKDNPACGIHFKSYQFTAKQCTGRRVKCGLQRQPPNPKKDNFIGVIRRCYTTGTLPGVDDSNGCTEWKSHLDNFTALMCFCDTDYCNGAVSYTNPITHVVVIFVCLVLAIVL